MNPVAHTARAAVALVAAIPAVTKAAWKVASMPAGDSYPFSLTEGFRTFGRAWAGGLTAVWGAWFGSDYTRLVKLAFTNPVAARGIRLVAQAASDAPVYVEKRDGSSWAGVETGFDDLLDLLERPNERTSRETLMLAVVTALYCGGEFWVRKEGPVTGSNAGRARRLTFIMPDEFVSFSRADGAIVGYHFRRGAHTYSLTTDECLHVRLFHPSDPDRGLAILVSAADQMEHMAKATAWNASIAEGGGRVPGYWKPVGLQDGTQLTADQQAAAQASFNQQSKRAAQENAEMVLSGAFDRVSGDITPKDADWHSGLAWDLRMIATMVGVSPTLLGDEKGGSLTDAGVDSEVRAAYVLTVLPLLSVVYAELSRFLLPPGHRFAVDTDQIPAMQEDMDAKFVRYGRAMLDGLLTREESRVGIGYADVPDLGAFAPPPVALLPAVAEETDEPAMRALKALTDDGFEALLNLIPVASA